MFDGRVESVGHPAGSDFNNDHAKSNNQNGSSDHSQRNPRESVVHTGRTARVVVGTVVAGSPSQKQSKVGQMVGLTTKLIVPVPEMKTLVFAFPFL